MSASGQSLGEATISEDASGVTVRIVLRGAEPGPHAAHVHAIGRCAGDTFESAGPHWNPRGRKHGRDNAEGSHLGDLANIQVGENGSGESTFLIAGERLTAGDRPLLDLDGAAVVVHARADDYQSDPDGASGQRVACAAFNL